MAKKPTIKRGPNGITVSGNFPGGNKNNSNINTRNNTRRPVRPLPRDRKPTRPLPVGSSVMVSGNSPMDIANQLWQYPSFRQTNNSVSELSGKVEMAVEDLMNVNSSYRIPPCSSGQGYCGGTGLCLGGGCIDQCKSPGTSGTFSSWTWSGMGASGNVNASIQHFGGTISCNVSISF